MASRIYEESDVPKDFLKRLQPELKEYLFFNKEHKRELKDVGDVWRVLDALLKSASTIATKYVTGKLPGQVMEQSLADIKKTYKEIIEDNVTSRTRSDTYDLMKERQKKLGEKIYLYLSNRGNESAAHISLLLSQGLHFNPEVAYKAAIKGANIIKDIETYSEVFGIKVTEGMKAAVAFLVGSDDGLLFLKARWLDMYPINMAYDSFNNINRVAKTWGINPEELENNFYQLIEFLRYRHLGAKSKTEAQLIDEARKRVFGFYSRTFLPDELNDFFQIVKEMSKEEQIKLLERIRQGKKRHFKKILNELREAIE